MKVDYTLDEDDYNIDDCDIDEDTEQLLNKNKVRNLKYEVKNLFDELDEDDIAPEDNFSISYDEIKNNFKLQNKVVSSFCNNIDSDIKIKKFYAKTLIIILAVQFIALDIIFVAAGTGKLKFSDLSLNLFIGGGLLEIVGIVTIIVKYLFNDNTTESLRIITGINKK